MPRRNLCNDCIALKHTVCPVMTLAYERNLSGMEICEVRTMLERVVAGEAETWSKGPKAKRERKRMEDSDE